jgi:hypothetical protein
MWTHRWGQVTQIKENEVRMLFSSPFNHFLALPHARHIKTFLLEAARNKDLVICLVFYDQNFGICIS